MVGTAYVLARGDGRAEMLERMVKEGVGERMVKRVGERMV